MGMLFTCGEAVLVAVGNKPALALGHRPSLLQRCSSAALPYLQVVKDVADKGDIADPALQGACSQLLPGLILLLQPVEEPTPKNTLAHLLTLCL